ncbi:Rv3235 family protein [Kitasatospora sp. NPDC002227]|uniref:Rv3235 family protein n=1 Tax=Kitasatospora sp. NPDC002227 TaxID=3154773 RepID=UPI00331B18DA
MLEPGTVRHLTPRQGPRVRPLVHPTGHPAHPAAGRRPVRTPHEHTRPAHQPAAARTEPPRQPRHPRAACAPSRGHHGELASRFAQRLVEVLTGLRPPGQLQRHTTVPAYRQLTALARSGPLRPRGRTGHHRLGRVHDSVPGPGALEVCVRVELGPRHHMVAFRLEQHRRTAQWQCAAVEAH